LEVGTVEKQTKFSVHQRAFPVFPVKYLFKSENLLVSVAPTSFMTDA